MDIKLKNHYTTTKKEIQKLDKELESTATIDKLHQIKIRAERLYRYHQDMTRNFQHERFIHLIVTLFFACLVLSSALGFLYLAASATSYTTPIILVFTIFIILTVTEVFYVAHYYKLENGTQKLYELSEKLEKIIKK